MQVTNKIVLFQKNFKVNILQTLKNQEKKLKIKKYNIL